MKKFLENLIKNKTAQRKALSDALIASETKEERASIGATLEALEAEIAEAREALASLDDPADEGEGDEGRSLDPVAIHRNASSASSDPRDSQEYRTAFMNYVCRGTAIPAELRESTLASENGAVIPTTVWNKIIQEMKAYGGIYAKVTKLNIKGGVKIPVLSLKPTASWVGETSGTDQKLQTTSVSFNYFGLEVKIAQSLLAEVVTIDAFQQMFVPLATEAIMQALDLAIVKGAGTASPLGITVDTRVPAGNKVTLTPAEFASWDGWKKKVFGKMKKAYRNGIFLMAQSTFDGHIDGMVDQNGQPIGRVNYGIAEGESYRFGGKQVETVEDDIITPYDSASEGDIVAVFFNPADYVINSNMELRVTKWTDHDTNEVKNKVMLIADGKLADANGVILIKKGAEA